MGCHESRPLKNEVLVARVFNPWIPEEYPKRFFFYGFRYVNVSLAHFALTEIGSSSPTRTH